MLGDSGNKESPFELLILIICDYLLVKTLSRKVPYRYWIYPKLLVCTYRLNLK